MDQARITEARQRLRGKRAAFVEEYIKCGNGAEAAKRAGIPEKGAGVQASRFLREPEVLYYRDLLMEAAAEAIGVSRDSLIVKSEKLWEKCMAETEDGIDSRGAARALELQAKLIGALSERRELEGGGFEIKVTRMQDPP